jgi:oxygen-independent coproporphyrinogen-3 oxidase
MWTYHPALLERAVPRYTSYPTAAEFRPDVGATELGEALDAIPARAPLSLYVHIPYCHEICSYCGCNTGRANRSHRLAAYLEALDAEIDMVADRLSGRGMVSRIAFGGGSPNAIAPLDFVRLVDRLTTRFRASAPVISVEIDPRTLDAAWLATLRTVGVQRVSLGVQTFDPMIQNAIGRVQPDAMIARAVAGFRDAGVASINFDLMYGLPGQTIADVERSATRAIELGADRIALFGYAHLPSMFPRQRRIDASDLPDAALRFRQAAAGHDLFVAAGYVPVGFDHFARPDDALAIAARDGTLRRNFQGFTEDGSRHLIGFGASAISDLPTLLIQNQKNAGIYRETVAAGLLPVERGIRRDRQEQARARVIEQLLCAGRARAGRELLQAARPALAIFAERQLLRIEDDSIELAADALPYARLIAACFDGHRPISEGRFSNAI